MPEKCFICDARLDPSGVGVTQVREKGIKSLLSASEQREDNKGSTLRGITTIKVHILCRKNYTRVHTIQADLKKQSVAGASSSSQGDNTSVPLRRSSVPKFDFKTKCFLCTEVIDEDFIKKELKKPIERRKKVYYVRTLEMKDKVVEAANRRKDQWAEEVKVRLSSINDIVAAEGVYHLNCYRRFFTHMPSQHDQKRGCPQSDYISQAMEEIYSFIENGEECQLSFADIRSAVTGQVPSNETIRKRLEDKYGERIIIAVGAGWKNATVCFNDVGFNLNSWYDNRKSDESEERLRIVNAAAQIVRQDIQNNLYDTSTYPPGNNSFKEAAAYVPTSLHVFLDTLIMRKANVENRKRKCISIAHSIFSAMRPDQEVEVAGPSTRKRRRVK